MKTKTISVAPMIDWTTRDYRIFARLFNRHTHLYTEMISTSAILQGDSHHHLWLFDNENPVVLQLGGSNPIELAQCVKIAQNYSYHAINLNVGCPSDRVQHNKIGACLMAEPQLVQDCVCAMADNTDKPISIKHRIGIDHFDSYEFMRDFVACVAESGVDHFIVHARTAWLKGFSPKENREIPPLRYEAVYRLKSEFPQLFIEINGGINTINDIKSHLKYVDGVMIGRAAYHNPYLLSESLALWGENIPTRQAIFETLIDHLSHHPTKLSATARHYMGISFGLKGARAFRQTLSDQKNLTLDTLKQAGDRLFLVNTN